MANEMEEVLLATNVMREYIVTFNVKAKLTQTSHIIRAFTLTLPRRKQEGLIGEY